MYANTDLTNTFKGSFERFCQISVGVLSRVKNKFVMATVQFAQTRQPCLNSLLVRSNSPFTKLDGKNKRQ